MHIRRLLLLAAAVLAGPFAHADDNFYVGLSAATPGEFYANFSDAKHVRNQNSPHAFKLYGGFNFSTNVALETGYGAFGTWKTTDSTPGSNARAEASSNVLYAAVRGNWQLSDAFTVTGKVGLARNHLEMSGTGISPVSMSPTGLMLGFGTDYAITKKVSAVLEYNYYGKADSQIGFRQQKLEAGVKYSF